MLSIKNLKTRTAHTLSADVNKGAFVALMGVNGSGKSTLLFTMAGLLMPSEGIISFGGENLMGMTSLDRAKKIALLSTERSETLSLSVREAVALGRVPHTGWSGRLASSDDEAVDRAIADFELEKFASRNAARLSDGERQRVALARVAAQTTDIILLDEPLSHLDIPWQRRVISLFRRLADEGRIIIAALHEFDHAMDNADEIWLLCEETGNAKNIKKVLRGSPEELRRNGIFEKIFGTSPTPLPPPSP